MGIELAYLGFAAAPPSLMASHMARNKPLRPRGGTKLLEKSKSTYSSVKRLYLPVENPNNWREILKL